GPVPHGQRTRRQGAVRGAAVPGRHHLRRGEEPAVATDAQREHVPEPHGVEGLTPSPPALTPAWTSLRIGHFSHMLRRFRYCRSHYTALRTAPWRARGVFLSIHR